MKKVISIVVVLMLVGAGLAAVLMVKKKSSMHDHEHSGLYYCPMHPYYQSDSPGKCPICHMDLVKKPKEDAGDELPVDRKDAAGVSVKDHATVKFNEHQRQLIGVKTAIAKRQTIMRTVRAYGYVTHSTDLYKLQDEYIQAYTEFIITWRSYKRYVDRRKNWEAHRDLQIKLLEAEHKLLEFGLSEQRLDQLRHVDWREAWNQPELMLFNPETNNYWIFADIFEDDLGYVDIGEEVDIEIPAYKEKLKGAVYLVGGAVKAESRTVRIFIKPKDYQGELVINLLAYVTLNVQMENKLTVPREAIMDTGIRKIIFIERPDGHFEPREIKTEAEGGGLVAVTDGLKEGERVVVNGNFLLDSESRLQAALQSFDQSAGHGGH